MGILKWRILRGCLRDYTESVHRDMCQRYVIGVLREYVL